LFGIIIEVSDQLPLVHLPPGIKMYFNY